LERKVEKRFKNPSIFWQPTSLNMMISKKKKKTNALNLAALAHVFTKNPLFELHLICFGQEGVKIHQNKKN
jgi:hypothetical protein